MEAAKVFRDTLPWDFLSKFLKIFSGLLPSSSHSVLVSANAMMLNLCSAAFLMPSIMSGRFSLDHFRPLMFLK